MLTTICTCRIYSCFGCTRSRRGETRMVVSRKKGARAHFHRPSLVHCGHFRSLMPRMCLIYCLRVCVLLEGVRDLAVLGWQRRLLPTFCFTIICVPRKLWAHLYIQSISGRGKRGLIDSDSVTTSTSHNLYASWKVHSVSLRRMFSRE